MSKSFKRILFAIAGLSGLLVVLSALLLFFVDTSVYKPRLERAASDALGMEVRVTGRVGIAFFPGLQIRFHDVHVRNREMDIASVQEAALEIALPPLLHKEIRVRRIGLKSPRITIQRNRNGVFNFEKPEEAQKIFPALVLDNISLTDGIFLYRDEQLGDGWEATKFNLDVHRLRIA